MLIVKFKQYLKKYKQTDFNTISNAALKKIYIEFVEQIYGFIPQAFIVSEILEKIATEKIVASLQGLANEPALVYTKLVTPAQSSTIGKEYIARLSLAIKLKRNLLLKKDVKKHLKKFGWVALYSPIDELVSEVEFYNALRKLSKKPNIVDELRMAKRKAGGLKKISAHAGKGMRWSPHDRLLVKVMRRNAWMRTYRRELVSQGFYQMRPMYVACAQRLNLGFSDLRQIACWEIAEYLNNSKVLSRAEIAQRNSGYIFLQQDDRVQIISGQVMSKIFDPEKTLMRNSNLSGLPVYHGHAVGSVMILHKKIDLDDFKEGDILVAPTVGTWMMPAVEKCAGIITDAGGVLSHTAIVAREFRKTCIVATKYATKVLKNGQVVTMDTKSNTIQ